MKNDGKRIKVYLGQRNFFDRNSTVRSSTVRVQYQCRGKVEYGTDTDTVRNQNGLKTRSVKEV